MKPLQQEMLVCVDCEMTGLDREKDRILEVAAVKFTLEQNFEEFQTLIDPVCEISPGALEIHKITPEMIAGKPKIEEILPGLLAFIGRHTIMGHGISNDIELISDAAKRAGIPCNLQARPYIDTLRLARLYGDSPNNSLGKLAQHFNIPLDDAHRAMNDVRANIEVFKHLVRRFNTVEQLFNVLDKPIKMKTMPLGKYKGRLFSDLPLDYLQWAARMEFDQDLLYTIRLEIKRRKTGRGFSQVANPFSELD